MKQSVCVVAAFMSAQLAAAAAAQAPAEPRIAVPVPTGPTHFVVFNKPGPNWHRRADSIDDARRHRDLYLGMAAEGLIVAGGALMGEPILGMSIFRTDVDRAAIRSALEADPLVLAGVTALEYREWFVQMGGIAPAAPQPAATAARPYRIRIRGSAEARTSALIAHTHASALSGLPEPE